MNREGFVNVKGGRVWYEVMGPTNGQTTQREDHYPLIVLHGGPGSSHISMRGFAALADEREVVWYDQLGCGKSDRPADTSLWTIERFVEELATLRRELGYEQVHILGHSWGTMLLADYLLTNPTGVASAIFSSPCLSALRWAADADKLRLQLPKDVQDVLTECETNGTTDSEAYREAEKVYTKMFVCRVDVSEEDKERRKAAFGKEVYEFMWGPSEFFPTGNLKGYDRTNVLDNITVPALFTCGQYDEATPESTAFYHSLVPGSQFHVFEDCAHSPLREQPEAYLRFIRNFIQSAE